MYRLLTIKRATTQNIKYALVVRGNGRQPNVNTLSKREQQQQHMAATSGMGVIARSMCSCWSRVGILGATNNLEPHSTKTLRNFQSTTTTRTTNAEMLSNSGKKKKRRNAIHYGRYVDILEVTQEAAKERISRVRRLNAKKLQRFITKTQVKILEKRAKEDERQKFKPTTETITVQPIKYQKVNIDEALESSILEVGIYDDKPMIFIGDEHTKRAIDNTEEVQNILKSYDNFREMLETVRCEKEENDYGLSHTKDPCNVDEMSSTEPYISPEVEINNKHEATKTKKMLTTLKSKSKYKSKVHNSAELERLAKERALRINLTTYLNVCVSVGLVNRGLSTLYTYRQRAKKVSQSGKNPVNIHLYNILLHGFAEKGSFDRFKEIFNWIAEDKLSFNEQTFAAIFECLGRVEATEENLTLIQKYIQKAENQGYTLNDIMDRSVFTADQRDIAMDAIQRIQPNFVPVYTPPPLGYDNVLLNHLNQFVEPIDKCEANTSTEEARQSGIEIMNSKRGYSKKQLEEWAREQLKIELDGCITIKSIEKTKEFANSEHCREKLKELEKDWHSQICAGVKRDLNTLRAQVRLKPYGYMNFYTYLRTLEPTQFADILLKEICKLAEGSETYSPTIGQLHRELGQKVQQRYQIEQKMKNGILEKVGDIYGLYSELWDGASETETSDNTRQMWQRLVHKERVSGPSMDIREVSWPPHILAGVGRFLYNILMRDIKIDVNVMRQKAKSKQQNLLPAFYTLFRNQGRIVKEEVKPHPVLSRLFRASRQKTLTFESSLVPMLCPPQPWSTPHNGGYLLNKSELIRLPHQAIQQWDRINASNPQHLYPSLDSLNQLASVAWRVNTDVLDVIVGVFQNGGNSKLDVPQPPASLPPLPTIPEADANISNVDRAKLFKEKLGHRRKQAEMYSLWCDTLYRLSLANHYRDKVFWLPHNMDFRGRVYPIPPHLNHLGSDLARSMLVFDQPQPLGVDGFTWLKLHCINLTGLKKRNSVRERLLYAEDIMDEILDSADNPLTGHMWWAKSDEPWQTLACCMEIAKVHRSPDPEKYLSHFPIHQDGSCNGLQHYAALGRDQAGAVSVNLAPSKVPQDVYSAVAALVEKSRENDADNGLHVAQALEGFVKRKVIKQTVMTTVYGVTRYGARLQIARQLKDLDDFPKEWVWPASTYLTTKTFESLREMFTSTREIQDWFTDCARLISSICSKNVEWVTPLGLPVVQPYSRTEIRPNIRSNTKVPETMPMDMYERPNVMKQKNAFPPNFIHSLDSSHMMLTSLHCERHGMTFISVHDCFWTHACTVPDLNRICREQFVALHSQPILEDLSKFLMEKYYFKDDDFSNDGNSEDIAKRQLNRVLGQVPKKGTFDLRNVLNSIYFFS